ncbi:MAG: hypothetical protein Q4G18_08590 [Myroides sp.]|nr:hypothetical protein [Myroides sp.]
MKSLLYLSCFLFLFSCKKDELIIERTVEIVTVMPCKVLDRPALGYFGLGDLTPAYSLQREDGSKYTLFRIKGFEDIYEEGTVYTIRMRKEEVVEIRGRDPYQDEYYETKYFLEEILSTEKATAECPLDKEIIQP